MNSARNHILPAERVHYVWDETLSPVLEIASGETVTLDTRVLTEEQLLPGANADAILTIEWDRIHPLTGPIYVADAMPGDTLEIRIEMLRPGSWGVSWIDPTYGLLMGEFGEPAIKFFDLTDPTDVRFSDNIRLQLAPFLGVMGVAPTGPPRTTYAPGDFGGNLDCKRLIEGSSLFLPIFVEGALFSTGDAHAIQGDGEICSAIECPMSARLCFTLHKGTSIPGPRAKTRDLLISMGHADNLLDAVREATRCMITWLVDEYGLSSSDAYILCSLAGDPCINEVVNGNPVVFGARYELRRDLVA